MRRLAFYTTLLLAAVATAQSNTPVWRNGSQEKMCGLGTYQDGLDLAFKNATIGKGETLFTLQVLPSFEREYAFILKRDDTQLKLLRVRFQDQLWSQVGALSVPRTREQCLELATAAKVSTVELSVPREVKEQLWSGLSAINLDTDICPRINRACAPSLDGTSFVIQTYDGRLLRLTEISGMKNVKSENSALLEWVHALIQTAKNYQPQ